MGVIYTKLAVDGHERSGPEEAAKSLLEWIKASAKKGESHALTNEVGAPIPDNENAITAGPRGPVVLSDVWLLEKMAHFNREVIPERRMEALVKSLGGSRLLSNCPPTAKFKMKWKLALKGAPSLVP